MDRGPLAELLAQQGGVISRSQLLGLGVRPHDIARQIRRRQLARIHPGVYVDHTGPLSWSQRAWAGVLAVWPAALCDESALHAESGPGSDAGDPIHVAVALDRHVLAPHGVRVHHRATVPDLVSWHRSPPRVRYEDAALDVAARARTEFAALAVLAEACRTRRTTPQRLADTLAQRSRMPRRGWMSAVLADLAAGTCSVLERQYLTDVERAHGLPRAGRQVPSRASAGAVYRDVEYAVGLVLELDGRLVHNTVPQRDADFERDLGRRGGRAVHRAAVLGTGRRAAVQHRRQDRSSAAAPRLARQPPPLLERLPGRRRMVVEPTHRMNRIHHLAHLRVGRASLHPPIFR